MRLARPRIPVTVGSLVIEMAGLARAMRILQARNASPVYTRKRTLGAIELRNFGDDSQIKPAGGNPQRLSTCAETEQNPNNVWMLKPLKLVTSLTTTVVS